MPRYFDNIVSPYAGQQFSIGIYAGNSILDLKEPSGLRNPVLSCNDVTDAPAAFVADPFMIRYQENWHMLFEVMNRATRRGQIAWARSKDGIKWDYQGTVLHEPFHLAYPHTFEYDGDMYMVPDSPGNGIRLYRALSFPDRWQFVCELRSDNSYSDATIFQREDLWWMFVAWSAANSEAKSLRLFSADNPTAEWQEHPASPVVANNDHSSRPAGRVVFSNGKLIRLAQDCESVYGQRVNAFEVLELSPDCYAEQPLSEHPILDKGPENWRLDGMHHADVHSLDDDRLIACVDGWKQIGHETASES